MMDVYGLFNNYGNYSCNVGKLMDEAGISISKMGRLTGLNHDIVKKYYNDQIQRIDKEVLAKITYVLMQYGLDTNHVIEYNPPKEKDDKTNKSHK